MTVLVDDGSMVALLASTLVEKRPLTAITNSAAVLDGKRTEPAITLMAQGGIHSAKYSTFSGALAEGALSRLRADLAFVSTAAVAGCRAFHTDDEVVRTRRRMMIAAAQYCLLINHKRFGRSALHVLAGLTAFDVIITDAAPAPEERAALGRADINLTIARDEA